MHSGYPQRRNIALPGHDYKGPKSYFVTMRVLHGECIFGEVVGGDMRLSLLGKVVEEEWLRAAVLRPYVTLDAHIVMPNHFHGILDIHATPAETPDAAVPHGITPANLPMPRGAAPGSLGAILGQFKSVTTKRCRALGYVKPHPMWLRRWHDRVIRSESEKADIRRYIWDNPVRWEQQRRMRRG